MPHWRTTAMFEAGVVTTVRAWHVMPGMEGPEGELHPHDYRIEVTARRGHLDEQGMVVDIDLLTAALEAAVELIRERNLDEFVPHDDGSGLTVELLARWMCERVREHVDDPAVAVGVRVWESAHAFGGYRSASTSS